MVDEREVSYDEGAALAKEYGLAFFETSAKENININEMFDYLIKSPLTLMRVIDGYQPNQICHTEATPKSICY